MLRRRVARIVSAVVVALVAMVAGCRGLLGIEDAPLLDGAPTDDGGLPDSAEPDAGTRFCATRSSPALLCDDFDDPSRDIRAEWDNTNGGQTGDLGLVGGGSIEADTTVFYSGPRSAALDVSPLLSNAAHGGAMLIKLLKRTPTSLRVEARLRIVTESIPRGGGGRAALFAASFLPGGSVNVIRDESGTSLWVSVGDVTPQNSIYPFRVTDFVVGRWSSITILIENTPSGDGGAGRIEIMLDGLSVASAPLPAAFQVTGEQELSIGPLARGPMGQFRLDVDDVVIAP